jgi:hypothetical protein
VRGGRGRGGGGEIQRVVKVDRGGVPDGSGKLDTIVANSDVVDV